MYARLSVVALAVMLLWPAAGAAQIVGDDVPSNFQAPWNSLNAAAISQRGPGSVVATARASFDERHGNIYTRSQAGPEITEEPPDLTLGQQVRVQVLETVLENLNEALAALAAAIRLDLGLPPVRPGDGTSAGGGLDDLLGTISGPG